MKRNIPQIAIRHIDRALKNMNALDLPHRAEQFIVSRNFTVDDKKVANRDFQGALLVRNLHSHEISLGIYLTEDVLAELSTFGRWKTQRWTLPQLRAFGVAAEEISHFHYLLYRAHRKESLSQLELEIQGEVDRFFLTYFANLKGRSDDEKKFFDELVERFFFYFHLAPGLSAEERSRYRAANLVAKRFVVGCRKWIKGKTSYDSVLGALRRFYRLGGAEKKSTVF